MKKSKTIDFSKELRGHEDKWVALSADETKLVASDKSFDKAVKKARKKGEENPVLLKVLCGSYGYIL